MVAYVLYLKRILVYIYIFCSLVYKGIWLHRLANVLFPGVRCIGV